MMLVDHVVIDRSMIPSPMETESIPGDDQIARQRFPQLSCATTDHYMHFVVSGNDRVVFTANASLSSPLYLRYCPVFYNWPEGAKMTALSKLRDVN